jgi:hypothetical protein
MRSPSTPACGKLGSGSTAPSRLLPRPFQPPSETCLPIAQSSKLLPRPFQPLPRPVRSPPRARNRAGSLEASRGRPRTAKPGRASTPPSRRPPVRRTALQQNRIRVLQAVTKEEIRSGSRGITHTRGPSDGRPAPQPTLFTLIVILN